MIIRSYIFFFKLPSSMYPLNPPPTFFDSLLQNLEGIMQFNNNILYLELVNNAFITNGVKYLCHMNEPDVMYCKSKSVEEIIESCFEEKICLDFQIIDY